MPCAGVGIAGELLLGAGTGVCNGAAGFAEETGAPAGNVPGAWL